MLRLLDEDGRKPRPDEFEVADRADRAPVAVAERMDMREPGVEDGRAEDGREVNVLA
jgi:hypothetical protein